MTFRDPRYLHYPPAVYASPGFGLDVRQTLRQFHQCPVTFEGGLGQS